MKQILITALLFTFFLIFNVNSGTTSFGVSIINSPEIKDNLDLSKKKISLKNAEVKFNDGSNYVGPIRKNKLHGKGKLVLPDGTIFEGKFKSNKFVKKHSRKTRTFVKIDLKKGIVLENQMKVAGLSKYYPAEIIDGEFKLSKKGELMVSQDKKNASGGDAGSGGSGGSGGGGC